VYARSTTVLAHLESIDAGVAHIRDEVMPMLLAMDGCVGLSMLADRNSGRCIATSAWRTREAMLASERRLRRVRDHAAEILGNRRTISRRSCGSWAMPSGTDPGLINPYESAA
jgi:hypothetical protein